MRKFVDGFVHTLGVHCESTAIRDVLNYYGLRMSEEMVFGFDCTFGFAYWKEKFPYSPFYISGKICTFPNTLPKLLGVNVEKKTTSDTNKAWKAVKDLIDRNIPVPIFVDMYYLDYMQIPKEPWNHFGNHMVVLAGYNEERGEAYVADSTFKEMQTVPLKSLTEARNSKFEPCPPENAWFEISMPKKIKPLDKATKMAIKETAKNMLNPPEANYGIKGMIFLAQDIIKWAKLPISVKELKLALFLQYIDLEIAGTSGGNFRKLYSRFLKEASKLHNKELGIASEKMAESAKLWSETANLILNSSQKTKIKDINKTLSKTQQKIIQCAKIEEALFTKLLTL